VSLAACHLSAFCSSPIIKHSHNFIISSVSSHPLSPQPPCIYVIFRKLVFPSGYGPVPLLWWHFIVSAQIAVLPNDTLAQTNYVLPNVPRPQSCRTKPRPPHSSAFSFRLSRTFSQHRSSSCRTIPWPTSSSKLSSFIRWAAAPSLQQHWLLARRF